MNRYALLFLVSFLPGGAFSAEAAFTTKVTRTLSDVEMFGGCMALLADAPVDVGLNCSDGWVTFSCSGDFAEKDAAQRNFDTAQIALLTNANVRMFVDDSRKHNNRCFANRIQLFQPQ